MIYHHAFASVVQFGCIGGVRRDAVIQTMRTFVAINKIFKLRAPGKFSFDEVVNLISKDCYGPIKLEHAKVWKQNNFEYEYLDDIEAAQILISALPPTVIYGGERDQ